MKSKKVLAVLLAMLMLLSSVTVAFSVFASSVAEAAADAQAEDVVYTREELKDISDKYGYDLSEDQINAIANGEVTLSETVADKEDDTILIVQLSSEGALAQTGETDVSSNKIEKARRNLAEKQETVQGRISRKVLDGADVDVMYSYTLLTNSFAMTGKPSQINEIASIRGVESVYTAPVWTPVPTDAEQDAISTEHAANYFTGSDNTTSLKGTGSVVAIIDTGLDSEYTYNATLNKAETTFHKAFRAPVDDPKLSESDILARWQSSNAYSRISKLEQVARQGFINSLYRSTKVPYGFNYADDNVFVGHKYNSSLPSSWSSSWAWSYWYDDEQGDHGTHVSGITAGYKTDAEGKVIFEGVAPDAQLLVMKVFGNNRAGSFADILAAMEDSVLFGADVINLSLGSWAGFTYGGEKPDYDAAFQAAADAGIVVCASAGNEYSAAKGTLYGNDKALASNPDNGILGAPASYDDNLAVASMASKDYYAKSVQIAGRNIAFTNNASESVRSIEKHAGTSKNYVVMTDENGNMLTGTDGDFEKYGLKLYGNYVVIRRGETFTETVQRAADASAIGLIVCDHSDGSLVNMMENTDVKIPAIFISKADGDFILSLESDPTADHLINITNTNAYTVNPDAGKMSDFSSWGVTPDLKLKPEITGYGGSVYSTLQGDKYGLMSGTSMSSPYLAGVSALVVQSLNGAVSSEDNSFLNFEAAYVNRLASEIGTIDATPACEKKINDLEAAVALLPEESKSGRDLRIAPALATINTFYNQFTPANATTKLNAIGAITATGGLDAFLDRIEAARIALESLSAADQSKVTATNRNKLRNAQRVLLNDSTGLISKLPAASKTVAFNADNKKLVDTIMFYYNRWLANSYSSISATNYKKMFNAIACITNALINDIGTVTLTLASKAKIDEARRYYDNLFGYTNANAAAYQSKVTAATYEKLTDAEAAYANLLAGATTVANVSARASDVTAPADLDAYKESVTYTRILYNALGEEDRAEVANYAPVPSPLAGAVKQQVAKALMMSTARPVLFGEGTVPYSPRKQGAGLVNIDAALASKAYVTVDGSPTPKIDFGDDKAKTGVYELKFNVNNMGTEALTFDVSANVQTEKVSVENVSYLTRRVVPEKADAFIETGLEFREKSYAERVYAIDDLQGVKFMSGEPYDLTSMSTVAPSANTITVPAGGSVAVTVTVTLGADAKAYMDQNFANGIYVEGFITLTSKTAGQPDLNVPYMGFYGDWTQAPMLDEGTWEDNFMGNPVHPQISVSTGANIYYGSMVGYYFYPLGVPNSSGTMNPFDYYKEGATYLHDVRNVFGGERSLNTDMLGAELALLRSAKDIKFTVTDTQTGELYYETTTSYVRKSVYYSDSVGVVNAGYFGESDVLCWNGTIQGTQNKVEPGTQVTYTATVLPDYGTEETCNNLNNTFTFNAYYDAGKPKLDNIRCYLDEETGDVMLDVEASDDNFIGEVSYAICGYDSGGVEDTIYLHTMFIPEHAGDTVRETLNVSEWARQGGLLQIRNIRVTGEDFTQKPMLNPNPAYGGLYEEDYYLSFFDNVKVSCVTDIMTMGGEAHLDVDYTYGEKLLGGTPLIEDHNNSDFGLEEDFIYASSNPDVVRVSAEGMLIPVGVGYADVSATGRFGHSTDTMRIRVIDDALQKQVIAANAGDTITLTQDYEGTSLLIDKDLILDLNGHTIHGVDGSPAIRVIGGNVTIKNGSVDAKFGDNSKKPILTDILEDNAPAIKVEGGDVTLDSLKIKGATFQRDGETILGGSAVLQSGNGNLTVKNSDLTGLYAVNNAEAAGATTFVSGNFEGILGSVADMKKVTKSEGSELIDITNTLSDSETGYLGTIEGGSANYYLPTNCLYISAEQLAAATPSDGASVRYDEEKGCAVFTFDGSSYAINSYLAIPDVNIENCSDYTFAAILSNGMPSELTYTYAGFSSSPQTNNKYLSGESYGPTQDGSGKLVNYVKPLTNCEYFTGSAPTLYFWPGAGSYRTTSGSMDIYGIALYNNKADAMSFSVGKANAYTNNLKVCGPKSFNTQLIIDGTTLNVNTNLADDTDGKYKWTANELSLYTRTVNGDNTFNDEFVEAKPITPDENGDVTVSFEGIDPSLAYVVKVKFALSLTAEDKVNFFNISESSAAALVKAFPALLDDMIGVDEIEESVTNLANFFLYDMRQGFVERDARHYDCPLGPAYAKNYPYIDEYPNIICRNSNNNYTTWTAYWDKATFIDFIGTDEESWDGTVTRISYAILFASILGDEKMTELMANLQESIPASTWDMLDPVLRTGHYGQSGSIPAYKAQLAGLKTAAVGETPREQLVNSLSYLANNFIDLYASVLSVINSLYTPGVEFKSYSDPTANDSLLNVLAGKQITTTYNFGGYNDRQAEMIELVDAVYAANDYTQKAKNGLVSAMNAALYGTLASYKTEAADLMNLYFDSNPIDGGVIDLGRTVEYESEANYDGYITYELNGGVNNEANPIGYQRLLPVTFAEPTKEGYSFGGWYTSADFAEGTQITGTTASTEGDLTVYAKWNINVYTMTFMLGEDVIDTVAYTYGDPTAPTNKLNVSDGLTFKYWYGEDSSKAYEFGAMPAHDVVLKAQLSYMSLDSFNKNGDTYVWPKDDHASLRLTVDRDCTIDFGGKIVTNMNDLAIIVIEKGAKVTIKNAIFAPADTMGKSTENYTILVDSESNDYRSSLTLENCVVKGAVTRTADGSYASCSAIKLKNGSLKMDKCVVTGMYAVDNTKYSNVTYTPDVTYGTGVYAGVVRTFVSNTNVTRNTGRVIDASAFVADAPASDAYANRVIVVAPSEFNINSFDVEYLPDTDEVKLSLQEALALALPDGSVFNYKPVTAGVDGTEEALVDGTVTIGNIIVGNHRMEGSYNCETALAEETAAFIYDLDDAITAASKAEITNFDAKIPEYDRIITKWNNNKDKIISKFSQYADNALLKPYLKEMREAIDNINGTGSKVGILSQLEAKLDAYKECSTDTQKLSWLLANKTSVIELTVNLRENVDLIWNDCVILNGLANAFLGADYTDKLLQVKEIAEEVDAHCDAIEKLPSFAAADYAAASDKNAFVASLLAGSTAFAGEKSVNGLVDLGDKVSFTRYIDPTNESFSAPTKFTVLQNSKLSDIVIPEEFPRIVWKVPNTELKETGTFAVAAIYTPTDTVKYNTVEFTIDVEVLSPAAYCERFGHDYGDLIIASPDCFNGGNATRVCARCGDVKTEEVYGKLGHIDEDNNNICDRCKEYINDTGEARVNWAFGFLNFFSNLFRGIIQLFTGKSGSNPSSGITGSDKSIFSYDSFLIRLLRVIFNRG